VSRAPIGLAELAAALEAGDVRALARAISLVENGEPQAAELLALLGGRRSGRTYTVGLTGAPGAGKSTLAAALVSQARSAGRSVAVLSVDPTSPFSGGALLGDRIRLSEHFLDPGVFIRSMGSRGASGGLAGAAADTLVLLAAAGRELVFVETVGTGQGEVAVRDLVDTVVLVLMPGSGDSVQSIKAGVMEIPDLIAVNKRDLPGAAATLQGLRRLPPPPLTAAQIVATDALHREGVEELWQLIDARRGAAGAGALGELAQRRVGAALTVASAAARRYLENAIGRDAQLEALLEQVRAGLIDPGSAGRELARKVFPLGDED
jgi:LAO/AO transport system kinase